ncbi:RagB/SusD family nutrient uptake outer membrane protein [Galbibacter sp.]|uniref:RagB/SusD family nutrient uptake outer membrane protein n=1 Tax=Galbibacter sp. TaxID=2918471 RepID=UPI003A93E6F5
MKKYIKIMALVVGLSGTCLVSCNDSFLEEDIESAYTPESLNDELGFESALIGLYQQVSTFYTQSGNQGWVGVWQVGTDIVWPTQPQGIEVPYYEYDLLTPDDEAAFQTWRRAYNVIENANSIIYSAEHPTGGALDMTADQLKLINAEARFFRARSYNLLATLFGGVPLVTEPIAEPKLDYTRASLEEVNAQIEADLLYASQNLPSIDNTPAEARVSRFAANQLFAKFYLRVGEPGKAEDQADLIIDSGKFQLVDERYGVKSDQPGDPFSDMFFKGNQRRSQGNTEAIWVLENENPSDVRGGSTGDPQQRRVWGAGYHNRNGMIPADSLGGRGIARIRLNNWVLYDLYEDGDVRNSKYNIHRRFRYNNPDFEQYGEYVPYSGPDTLFIINPYTLKWGHFDPRDTFGYGMWKDFILMRLGETYLLKAEAQLMQSNPSGAAITINALRQRANAPAVSASDIDLDFILDERVRELLAEENRRMTLMRTGTLVERANEHNSDAPVGMQIQGLSDTHLLLPIPLREIQLNKENKLEQNPGY